MKYQRMKDVAVDVMEIAEESGYDYDFLAAQVEADVENGASYETAVDVLRAETMDDGLVDGLVRAQRMWRLRMVTMERRQA